MQGKYYDITIIILIIIVVKGFPAHDELDTCLASLPESGMHVSCNHPMWQEIFTHLVVAFPAACSTHVVCGVLLRDNCFKQR